MLPPFLAMCFTAAWLAIKTLLRLSVTVSKKIWDSITLWRFQEQFLKKERKMMTVLSCPKCGILKQGVPEDLDEFAEEILDEI